MNPKTYVSMSGHQKTRPGGVYLLLLLLLFQGVSGVAGGFGLISDPTGAAIGLPGEWLQGSPFTNYLIPGLVLFGLLGILPLVVVYALWARFSWSWPAALLVGFGLLVWIAVEILVIGYHPRPPLQLIYGVLGMVMVGVGLLPSVRRYSSSIHEEGNSRR